MCSANVIQCNTTLQVMERIPLNSAIVKVVTNQATTIEQVEGKFIRSKNLVIPAPSIIMLNEYAAGVTPYDDLDMELKTLYPSRDVVLVRDAHECCYCGKYATTIDHVIPRSLGGTSKWDNVVACCEKHNYEKADTLLPVIGWTMRYTPTRPTLRHLRSTPKSLERLAQIEADQELVYAAYEKYGCSF